MEINACIYIVGYLYIYFAINALELVLIHRWISIHKFCYYYDYFVVMEPKFSLRLIMIILCFFVSNFRLDRWGDYLSYILNYHITSILLLANALSFLLFLYHRLYQNKMIKTQIETRHVERLLLSKFNRALLNSTL